MTFDEYQALALLTAVYPKDSAVAYTTLGLCSEAGEVADKLKKLIRDSDSEYSDEFYTSVAKELGDVLWYVATLSHELGFNMSEVAEMNYNKLKDRYERDKIGGSGDER